MLIARTRVQQLKESQQSQQQSRQPEGWRFVPDTILPGYTGARSAGRPWVARTQFNTAVQCRNTANMEAELESIQGKNVGYKSTVDESLLCYGGLGGEEVHEVVRENFDEKECYDNGCKPLMLIMRVFEVVDEEREKWSTRSRISVKDEARGTEERVSTTSENNVYNTFVKPLSISTCSSMQRC